MIESAAPHRQGEKIEGKGDERLPVQMATRKLRAIRPRRRVSIMLMVLIYKGILILGSHF
jgi:hypothetical protein